MGYHRKTNKIAPSSIEILPERNGNPIISEFLIVTVFAKEYIRQRNGLAMRCLRTLKKKIQIKLVISNNGKLKIKKNTVIGEWIK